MKKYFLPGIIAMILFSCQSKERSSDPLVYSKSAQVPFYCEAIGKYVAESPESWIKKWQNIEFELVKEELEIPSYIPQKIGFGILEKCALEIVEGSICSESFEFIFEDRFGSGEKIILSQIRKNDNSFLDGAEKYSSSWISVSGLDYFPEDMCKENVVYFTSKIDNRKYSYKVKFRQS